MKLVGDEDDSLAGVAERTDDGEELLHLLRREDGCRLVEDQHVGRPEENLEDFHALLDSDRKRLDQRVGRHLHAVIGVDGLDLRAGGIEIKIIRSRGGFDAEDHVLDDAEDRHQHEMLVDHADAGGNAVAGPCEVGRCVVNSDFAGVGAVEARQDIHQRRFAGTVLAEKAEHFAGADVQVDVLVCLHRAETLADAAKLDIHEDRPTKKSRCPDWYGGSGSVA